MNASLSCWVSGARLAWLYSLVLTGTDTSGQGLEQLSSGGELRIGSASRAGELAVTGTFTNGVCTLLSANELPGPWVATRNAFTTNAATTFTVALGASNSFHRALARDLSGGRVGFTNLTLSYGLLTTIAGAGGFQDVNNWRPEFEGAPATSVWLSGPHMA